MIVLAMSQVGFIKSLAREGQKYGILCNAVTHPGRFLAESFSLPFLTFPWIGISQVSIEGGLIDTVRNSQLDSIVAAVANLAHPTNTKDTGSIFECEVGRVTQLRWARASGAFFRPDNTFTPRAIRDRWDQIHDFSSPTYPTGSIDYTSTLKEALNVKKVGNTGDLSFRGRVALVTGAGAG